MQPGPRQGAAGRRTLPRASPVPGGDAANFPDGAAASPDGCLPCFPGLESSPPGCQCQPFLRRYRRQAAKRAARSATWALKAGDRVSRRRSAPRSRRGVREEDVIRPGQGAFAGEDARQSAARGGAPWPAGRSWRCGRLPAGLQSRLAARTWARRIADARRASRARPAPRPLGPLLLALPERRRVHPSQPGNSSSRRSGSHQRGLRT